MPTFQFFRLKINYQFNYSIKQVKFNCLRKSTVCFGFFCFWFYESAYKKYSVSFVFETWTWTYRDRTVNVILQSFQTVYLVQYDRWIPFTVPDRSWQFLTILDRSWAYVDVFYHLYLLTSVERVLPTSFRPSFQLK